MKTSLPKLNLAVRPGLRCDIVPSALQRWSGDIRAAENSGATIDILDPIGADFFGEGVTAKSVSAALRAIGNAPVTVDINSPGGDVFEGIAIYNLLREHPGDVTVNILGLAASAASIVALAGNDVRIGREARFMIHNAWVIAMGDAPSLRDAADWLEPFDASMADVYAARSGLDTSTIREMMNRETWMTGQQAVDQGFADSLLASDVVSVSPSDNAARSMRAEAKFDLVASRAGLTRSQAKTILEEIKGAMPGAGLTGKRGAADTEPDALAGILNEIRSIGA